MPNHNTQETPGSTTSRDVTIAIIINLVVLCASGIMIAHAYGVDWWPIF